MTFHPIQQAREITKGPAAKEWALSMVDVRTSYYRVRGFHSTCECPRGNTCLECGAEIGISMRLLGTFNPDLLQEGFVFWGVAGHSEALEPIGEMYRERTERCAFLPPGTQLVYGWYAPKGRLRGWMAPLNHTLEDFFTLLFNSPSLKKTFTTHGDVADRQAGDNTLLPPDRLWGLLATGKQTSMRLLHERDEVEGAATFLVTSAERLAKKLRFVLALTHLREGKSPYSEYYPRAYVDVDTDGHWSHIYAHKEGVPHHLVAIKR